MKSIMILGAGIYQVPLIKKAKELGYETIVVSPVGNYPGINIADMHLDMDTTDSESILEAARHYKINGITTTGTDVCIPSIGWVVDGLELPGTGYKSALKSMDKVLMKKTFIQHNVPTAFFETFTEIADAKKFAECLGYPVMVKAADSSGSRGITKVDYAGDFHQAWNRALSVSRSKKIIVEQFLEGLEFGAQAFVQGNEITAVFPHADTVTSAPYFTPIGHSIPMDITKEQLKQTTEVIRKAVYALGVRDCICNVDLMIVDQMPVIIEIGARMGATCLPETVSIYTGMNLYEYLIQLATGATPEIKISSRQPNACLLLQSPEDGVLKNIIIPKELKNHPFLFEVEVDIKPGEKVKKFQTGPDRIGHIIVKGETAEEAEDLAGKLARLIYIDVE